MNKKNKENDFKALIVMTFTPCTAELMDNVAIPCNPARVKGYEEIGVIINRNHIDYANVTISPDNPRIIQDLQITNGATPFVIYQPEKAGRNPFQATQTEQDSASGQYKKTVQFYFEGIGGKSAKDVVEPLKNGKYVVVLERMDKRGDGSFQVFGYQTGLKAITQVENEETGFWLITMECYEPYAEMSLYAGSYAASETAFKALVDAAPSNVTVPAITGPDDGGGLYE